MPDNFPYLQGKAVNVAGVTDAQGDTIDDTVKEEDIQTADSMTEEVNFEAFIRGTRDSDFEREEAWYRWTYQVDQLDNTLMYANVVKRYDASPGSVYVRQGGSGKDYRHIYRSQECRRCGGGACN